MGRNRTAPQQPQNPVVIEKGVPIPASGRGANIGLGRFGRIVREMKDGDSIFFKDKNEAEAMRAAFSYAKVLYTQRIVKENGIKGRRLWRGKPNENKLIKTFDARKPE